MYKIIRSKTFWINILVFFTIYNVRFRIMSFEFSTWKFCYLLLLLLFYMKNKKIHIESKTIKTLLFFYCTVSLFAVIWIIYRGTVTGNTNNTTFTPQGIIVHLLLGFLFPFILSGLYSDVDSFLFSIEKMSLFQSIFVIIEFISSAFRNFISLFIVPTGNLDYSNSQLRAIGLGGEGAALSVKMALGIVAACYFLGKNKRNIQNFILILVILFATFLVARTGLVLELLCILFVLSNKIIVKKRIHRPLFLGISYLFTCIWVIVPFINFKGINVKNEKVDFHEVINRTFHISTRIFGETGFLSHFKKWRYPKLSFDSILGYGASRNVQQGDILLGADIGYVSRVISQGYVLAFIEYLLLAALLYAVWKRSKWSVLRRMFGFLIVMLFILEIKEQFIYLNTYLCFILSILFLRQKQLSKIVSEG